MKNKMYLWRINAAEYIWEERILEYGRINARLKENAPLW